MIRSTLCYYDDNGVFWAGTVVGWWGGGLPHVAATCGFQVCSGPTRQDHFCFVHLLLSHRPFTSTYKCILSRWACRHMCLICVKALMVSREWHSLICIRLSVKLHSCVSRECVWTEGKSLCRCEEQRRKTKCVGPDRESDMRLNYSRATEGEMTVWFA